jgi:hypothetical protein
MGMADPRVGFTRNGHRRNSDEAIPLALCTSPGIFLEELQAAASPRCFRNEQEGPGGPLSPGGDGFAATTISRGGHRRRAHDLDRL